MQLSAQLLGRVVWFVESADLTPRGAAFYPDIVRALAERYSFQKFPQRFEDFDESKGIAFEMGKIEDKTINKVMIFSNAVSLETTSSTQVSESILEEALVWATQKLGLHYARGMVKRKTYVNQFSFYSDAPLLQMNPVLRDLSIKTSKVVSENLKSQSTFEPAAILIGLDPEFQRIPTSAFSIERRQQTPFSDNKYFSAAPLPTDIHIELVEEFEKYIAGGKAKF